MQTLPPLGTLAAPRRRCARRGRAHCVASFDLGSFFETVKRKVEYELNYENWAPRGARAFRLRELPRDIVIRDSDKSPGTGSEVEDGAVTELSDALRLRYTESLESPDRMTGQELASLCYRKYGFAHDMAIVHKDMRVVKIVALNLYTGHLTQKSFPLTPEEYERKLDAVAFIIESLDCSSFVRSFFASPITPRGGLPSRPRADTAVTLRLNGSPTWDDALAEEMFKDTA